MSRTTKEQRQHLKEWAKSLYVRDKYTQKQIAETVGVGEKTVGKWKSDGNWDELMKTFTQTKEEQLKMFYDQENELNGFIKAKPEGFRFPSSKEADAQKKLTAAIRDLEREVNMAYTIDVSMNFLNWVRTTDFQKAKEMSSLFDSYIQSLLK